MSSRSFSSSTFGLSASFTALALLLSTALPSVHAFGPVYTSSFTWNQLCGPTVACGPESAGHHGIGFAAANNMIYRAGQQNVNGVGKGCGECWHLQPKANAYEGNGKKLGTAVVVKINDECTDRGYCDQVEFDNTSPLNTGYQKQVHFDLCNSSGVTNQFFGEIGIGVATGLAEQVDCAELTNGPFGSNISPIHGGGTADLKKAAVGVIGGSRGGKKPGGDDAFGVHPGKLEASTSMPVAQQPTTMATMVSSSSAAPPPESSTPATISAEGGAEDEQDDCDEL